MEPIVGVICEYDPFHRGHARQFALIREALPDAKIVCVMSGCFTQRGSPALFSPAFRAGQALRAGASLVMELPCAFAVREAENFALGGVALLNALGFVTHLSFGLETDNLPLLTACADALEQPTPAFETALHGALAAGLPFAAAQARALCAALEPSLRSPTALSGATDTVIVGNETIQAYPFPAPDETPDRLDPAEALAAALAKPNNILGISYLRALCRLNSAIQPLPVRRVGDYHADSLTSHGYPSASATRKAFLSGDVPAAENACGYPLSGQPFHRPEALDALLIHTLRTAAPDALRALPDCSEGLENRLHRVAGEVSSRAALITGMKTRRYAYARLNRLVSHALLGVTANLLREQPLPTYARLLGFRGEDRPMLSLLRGSSLPVLAKAADARRDDPLFALDARAYDLWALGAGLPQGMIYRQGVSVV